MLIVFALSLILSNVQRGAAVITHFCPNTIYFMYVRNFCFLSFIINISVISVIINIIILFSSIIISTIISSSIIIIFINISINITIILFLPFVIRLGLVSFFEPSSLKPKSATDPNRT